MRKIVALLVMVMGLVACSPDDARVQMVVAQSEGETVVAEEPPPPPPPSHCEDYWNAEAGRAHPVNQHEFNYLDAAGYARRKMACDERYLWGGEEFDALHRIVMAESKWNHFADNPTSSAYGIPQACPGSKMGDASAMGGADWRTNPRTQVRWMLEYIKRRYGTPRNAAYHRFVKGMY